MAIRLIFGKQNIFISEGYVERFDLTLNLFQIDRAVYDISKVSELIEIDRSLNQLIVQNIEEKLIECLEVNKEGFYPSLNSNKEIIYKGMSHTINLRSEIGSTIKFLMKLLSFFKEELISHSKWIEIRKEPEIEGTSE